MSSKSVLQSCETLEAIQSFLAEQGTQVKSEDDIIGLIEAGLNASVLCLPTALNSFTEFIFFI